MSGECELPQDGSPEAATLLAEDLVYEIVMLLGCAFGAVTLSPGSIQHNLTVEGFAIHARGLIDFLYQDFNPRLPDDALAQHYMPGNALWSQLRPPRTAELEGIRDRANKEVAHLTYARLKRRTPAAKAWRLHEGLAELLSVLRLFVVNADNQRLANRKAELLAILSSWSLPSMALSPGASATNSVTSSTLVPGQS